MARFPPWSVLLALLVGAVVVVPSCDRAKSDWQRTTRNGSRQAYESYIHRYPGRTWADTARRVLDSLDWKLAQDDGTARAYQTYLAAHASGRFSDFARQWVALDAARTAHGIYQVREVRVTILNQKDDAFIRSFSHYYYKVPYDTLAEEAKRYFERALDQVGLLCNSCPGSVLEVRLRLKRAPWYSVDVTGREEGRQDLVVARGVLIDATSSFVRDSPDTGHVYEFTGGIVSPIVYRGVAQPISQWGYFESSVRMVIGRLVCVIARAGVERTRIVKLLIRNVGSESYLPEEDEVATQEGGSIRQATSLRALLPSIADSAAVIACVRDPDTRVMAGWLPRVMDSATTSGLIDLLRDPDGEVRGAAATLLRRSTGSSLGADYSAWDRWRRTKSKEPGRPRNRATP